MPDIIHHFLIIVMYNDNDNANLPQSKRLLAKIFQIKKCPSRPSHSLPCQLLFLKKVRSQVVSAAGLSFVSIGSNDDNPH